MGTRRRGVVANEDLNKFETFLRKCTLLMLWFTDKLFFYMFGIFMTPIHYLYMMLYIRSRVVADCSTLRDFIEVPITVFAFINVGGNFVMNFITDTSLKRRALPYKKLACNSEESKNVGLRYCDKCKVYQPEGSWHCKKCDVCVVERDYHCFVFSQCVGRYTKRYYITGLSYALIGMIYHSYYAFQYPCRDDFHEKLSTPVVGSILRFFFKSYPHFMAVFKMFACFEKSFIMVVNFCIIAVIIFLLGFNVKNIIRGVYPWQIKLAKKKNITIVEKDFWSRSLKEEIEDIFGCRWYLAIFWPFASSPLPKPKEHLT